MKKNDNVPNFEINEKFTFCFITAENKILDFKFYWEKENKEFLYDHILYDIEKIEWQNQKVIITCHADLKETRIVNAFKLKNTKSVISITEPFLLYYTSTQFANIILDQSISIPNHINVANFAYCNKIKLSEFKFSIEDPPDFI